MDDVTQPVTPSSATGPPTGDAATPDLSGQTLGDFHIVRRLGQGGMGQVYLAEQRSLKRKVALKFLRPELAANPTALSRFRREAEAVARVTHANIVQVYSINADEPPYYMALEYVEGRNLKEYLTRKGRLDLPVALAIIRQVAAALQRAAESAIVHRDIKPENILLTRKGEVKVADFGLSRVTAGEPDLSLTEEGTTMGTPLYMSPEQAQGKPLDARSDIYSFGVMCYHILAGQTPFRGKSAVEVALKHVNDNARPLAELRPDLPPAMLSLIGRMMSKDPARRPQSGRDILREISQLAGGPTSANPFAGLAASGEAPTTALPFAAERPRRRAAWIIGLIAVLVALAGGAGLKTALSTQQRRAAVDDHPNLPVISNRERRLLTAIELEDSPKTPDKARVGAGHYVELGMIYWDQKRFDDAQQLFEEMLKKPGAPQQYKSLATLGLAVTYSLRDDVDRSNTLFLEARSSGPKPLIAPVWLPIDDGVYFRHWVVTALDRNATRPPANKEIEDMRKEVRWRPNLGGAGKSP
jgi:serine/threonine-protein kinase